MGTVHIRPRAEADLDEAYLYIAEDGVEAAERLLAAARSDMRKLADMPGMGASREYSRPELRDVRSWPIKGFRNYLIFFRPVPDGIEVLRVLHGARDVDAIMGQPR